MCTIYWLKSIDGIKLRLKRSVRTASSVKLEELRREVAESFASRRRGGIKGKKRGLARLVNLEKLQSTRTHDAKEDLVNSVSLKLTHRSSEEG